MMAGTQWARLDVGYLSNPKTSRVSVNALLLHLASVLYLAAHGIESGLLPPEALPYLKVSARIRGDVGPAVDQLVKQGLWHPNMEGGFLVHDYRQFNGAESGAVKARERQRRYREGGDA